MKDCLIEDASLILAEHYGIEEWTDPSVFRQDDVWAVGRVFPEELDPRTLPIQMGQPVNQNVYQSHLQSPERGFGGSSFTTHLIRWYTDNYWEQLTIFGQTVKSSRFRELHLRASRYPKASFDYITTAPGESDRIFYKPRSERTDGGGGGEAWGRAGGEEFQRG
ncbi:hypothetical protein BY996DRAFT_6424273 [Phakopsora pachyrhizi]|nr:hypothetical protein BY996DRAFT_6424273 [Phakopsora pachyrhizi]